MVISHDNNDLQTRYAHMTEIMVTAGTQVSAGQQIGTQGDTGASKGAHLHFEVIKPNPINPLIRSKDAEKVYDPMFFLGPLQ